jgi:hypothetical protein
LKTLFIRDLHSIDHPEYFRCTEEVQLKQTIESIKDIHNRFKLNYKVFSFPFTDFGIKKSFFDVLKNEIQPNLTFGCAGIKDDSVPGHLQRFPVEEFSMPIKIALPTELLYYRLSRVIGKHKIRRK